jgi:Ca2+-binding EF-hand superfamily protein
MKLRDAALVIALAANTAAAANSFDAIDTDHSGTISEEEALAAGRTVFELADKNADGKLEPAELRDRLAIKVIKVADPDADGAINPEEYSAIVKARLKSANADGDGQVSRSEYQTLAGKLLGAVIDKTSTP